MPTRPPSLRAVTAFEAAARHESFAKAADELNLTHSAISHAIRSLEERLDTPLFARIGRRVTLTRDGANLASRVRESLELLAGAIERRPATTQTRLSIGADAAIASRFLGPRLAAFAALHPEIGVDIRCVTSADALTSGAVDLVVRATAGADLGIATRRIVQERLYPVAASGLAGAGHGDELGRARLIESRQHPWSLWFSGPRRRPDSGPMAMSVDTDLLAIEMARLGAGVCLAPHHLVQRDLADGSLVRLDQAEVPARSGYQADWNPMTARRQEVAIFLAWLGDTFAPPSLGRRGRPDIAPTSAQIEIRRAS